MSADPDEFQRYLDSNNDGFLLLDHDEFQATAHVRFIGDYRGQMVIWDCCLMALNAKHETPDITKLLRSETCDFIEIDDADGQVIPLRIGLNIPRVDIPTMRKMMVMIRQYKRLGPGRHEFGAANPDDC
jgi:hypothetical protein